MNAIIRDALEGLESRADAFIFDCDGTLVDTMGAHYQSWVQAIREAGATQPLDLDRFLSLGGLSGMEVADHLRVWCGVEAPAGDLVRRKRELYLEAVDACEPIEPVAAIARRLSSTHPVAVVSGGHRAAVERSLVSTGLRELFEIVITPEEVPRGKPAPDMFLLAAERLGVAPERCLVFEDGPPGIEAARAAHMAVIVVEPGAVPT